MTRRAKIAVAVLAGLLLVVVCFAFLQPNAIRRSRQVHLGMNIAKVKAIMGPDTTEYPTRDKSDTITGYFLVAGHDSLINKVHSLAYGLGVDGYLPDWDTTVEILFNIDGRVKTIYRGNEPVVQAP